MRYVWCGCGLGVAKGGLLLLPLWQAIGKAEEEGTKKGVEAKTARAQAEKLQKECSKTEKEKVKAQGEVEKLMATIQASKHLHGAKRTGLRMHFLVVVTPLKVQQQWLWLSPQASCVCPVLSVAMTE